MIKKLTGGEYLTKIKQLNDTGYLQSYNSFSFYLYSLQLSKPEEELIFNHIRAYSVNKLRENPETTLFVIPNEEFNRLVTYDYNREEQYMPFEEREITQNFYLLKAKDIITDNKKTEDGYEYKFSHHFLRILQEEAKLITKMTGFENSEDLDISFIKILQYCMIKSSARPYTCRDVEIDVGELFAGKIKLMEVLGITKEDAEEGIQRALDTGFIKISQVLQGEGKKGNFQYYVYKLIARFPEGEDLYRVPFEGSFADKNYQENKPMSKDEVLDYLSTSPNFHVKINESKEVQRTLNKLLPVHEVPKGDQLLERMITTGGKLQTYTVKSLTLAFKAVCELHEKNAFKSYDELYSKLLSLLDDLKAKEDEVVKGDKNTVKEEKYLSKEEEKEIEDEVPEFDDVIDDIF